VYLGARFETLLSDQGPANQDGDRLSETHVVFVSSALGKTGISPLTGTKGNIRKQASNAFKIK